MEMGERAGRTAVKQPSLISGASDHIPSADRFYGELLGFRTNPLLPMAHFYGMGGYHHQIAGNVWQSPDAGRRDPGRLGLPEVQVLVRSESLVGDIQHRLASSGYEARLDDGGDVLVSDPWNIAYRLTPIRP